jgi:hypothetical protein
LRKNGGTGLPLGIARMPEIDDSTPISIKKFDGIRQNLIPEIPLRLREETILY